ncbi:hypothetical protein [Paraflavitalea pollutisoli]|uniref:hypothetical protein n=1 Tax=Paraflavitalea pollutisoli TaxID=3034143 RepID=UPI0023EA9557|nr:hypothetical protein [Paraflavitalea sp. H1-2-19X]
MHTRTLLQLLLLSIACSTQAQLSDLGSNPFMADATGRPLYLQTNYRSEGSPYYYDAYLPATVTALTGKVYTNIRVKLNVQTNELLYMADNGAEMIAAMPVRRIHFGSVADKEATTTKVLESVGTEPLNAPNAAIYEVADTGRIAVLKQIKVTYTDDKAFNQASVVRIFKRKETWHLRLANGQVARLETSKEAVLTLLADQQAAVTAYIDQEKLKCRTVDDVRKVIRYYNTLH